MTHGTRLALATALLVGGCNEPSSAPANGPDTDTETSSEGGTGSSGETGSSTTGDPSGSTSASASTSTSTSTGDPPPTTGDTDGEPVCVDYGEPCSQCEMESCEEIYCDCYGNPDCGQNILCIVDCAPGDTDCISSCQATYPGGVSDSVLLADCAAVNCEDECADFSLPPPLTTCERCFYSSCGPLADACVAVEGCPELLACVIDCGGDTACQTVCAGLYPAAVDAALLAGNCSLDHCEQECEEQ